MENRLATHDFRLMLIWGLQCYNWQHGLSTISISKCSLFSYSLAWNVKDKRRISFRCYYHTTGISWTEVSDIYYLELSLTAWHSKHSSSNNFLITCSVLEFVAPKGMHTLPAHPWQLWKAEILCMTSVVMRDCMHVYKICIMHSEYILIHITRLLSEALRFMKP